MQLPPAPEGRIALRALGQMLAGRSLLAGLEYLHRELGDIFRLSLPGFQAVVLVGPEAARFVYVTATDKLLWRAERDPVTKLLRRGVLVEDHQAHDDLRRQLDPLLGRQLLEGYAAAFVRRTDQVSQAWVPGQVLDMLVEMRRIALLILVDTLFGEDFTPQLDRLWTPILRLLRFISPGLWIAWPDMPRPGYRQARRRLDGYLYQLIAAKRGAPGDDMLSHLILAGLDDDRIRDQALTMLIAGHDTSTALLAWTLHLLGAHPAAASQARSEVERVVGNRAPRLEDVERLKFLGLVVQESLRLYPPIHLSNRLAAEDLNFSGHRIPAGTRVMHSIYLTHRHSRYWPDPGRFDPGRFSQANRPSQTPYTYLPFGGGRRNCIGSAFAKVEAHIVLARLLQRIDFVPLQLRVHPHMGATLEPRAGVIMRVIPRSTSRLHPRRVASRADS